MGVSRREEIINIAAELARMRADMTELKKQMALRERRLDELLAEGEHAPTEPDVPLGERVQDLLALSATPLTVEEIAKRLNQQENLPTLRTTLSRLAAKGGVRRLKRGSYEHRSAAQLPGLAETDADVKDPES